MDTGGVQADVFESRFSFSESRGIVGLGSAESGRITLRLPIAMRRSHCYSHATSPGGSKKLSPRGFAVCDQIQFLRTIALGAVVGQGTQWLSIRPAWNTEHGSLSFFCVHACALAPGPGVHTLARPAAPRVSLLPPRPI